MISVELVGKILSTSNPIVIRALEQWLDLPIANQGDNPGGILLAAGMGMATFILSPLWPEQWATTVAPPLGRLHASDI